MATNRVFEAGDQLQLAATHPTTPASGGPCRYGEMVGVALTDEQADGLTTIAFKGVFLLSVKGTTGSDSAVAAGDRLYYVDADSPPISKTTSGRPVGFAVATPGNPGTVGSGLTATIGVRLEAF